MSKVSIPEEYKSGFKEFLGLSDSQRQQLSEIFSQTHAKTPFDDMAGQIATTLGIAEVSALNIAKSVDSLFIAKDNGKLSTDGLISGLMETWQSSDYGLKVEELDSVKGQLQAFFSKGSHYNVSSKARSLATQRERILFRARILTDIRPIFSEEQDCDTEGEVIIHTLKVDYQEGGDNKSVYIALDLNDLIELKSAIDRAEKKDALLRKNIGSLKDNIVDPF